MVGFQLFSRRPCAGRQKQERFFVTWRGPSLYKGKEVGARAKWLVQCDEKIMSYVRQQRMKKVQIDCTGHFWMHLSAMKNEYCCRDIFLVMFWILASLPQIQVRIIQKVVKRINVFTRSTFYIWHIHLSCYCINSSFCSGIQLFFLCKASVP